ncbi:MAG: hypothetical protein WA324_10940 [Bryobacteraceae bacterium]
MSASPAQITANQANAQLSMGPKTEEGKAKVSLNAVSTGLTGRTVLLPSDDAKAYSDHIANYFVRFDPQTPEEGDIVQELAQTKWRLLRIPQLEEEIYSLGAVTFVALFEAQRARMRATTQERNSLFLGVARSIPCPFCASSLEEEEQPLEVRAGLIRAHTFLTHDKRFNSLYLQESRLNLRYTMLLKQLSAIQAQRQTEQAQRQSPKPIDKAARNGFEFSDSHGLNENRSPLAFPTAQKAKAFEHPNHKSANPAFNPSISAS